MDLKANGLFSSAHFLLLSDGRPEVLCLSHTGNGLNTRDSPQISYIYLQVFLSVVIQIT